MCKDCETLHKRLEELNGELFHIRKSLTKSRQETHSERRKKEKIIKKYRMLEDKQYVRNGQKRGKTRNG